MDDSLVVGGCYCRRVRYQVPLTAVRFGFATCHCSMCRGLHGAPSVMWLGIGKDQAESFTVGDASALSTFSATPNAERHFCSTCGTHTHLRYVAGAERWSGEIHVATATVDEACIAPLEELMRVRHKMSYEHVWFSDRAKCLHDLQAWADGPKRGGLTGIDPLATNRT